MTLAFSHDGATLATAGTDGTARVWDIDRGTAGLSLPIRSTSEVAVLAYHGNTLAAQEADRALTLWDAESAAVKVRLTTGHDQV